MTGMCARCALGLSLSSPPRQVPLPLRAGTPPPSCPYHAYISLRLFHRTICCVCIHCLHGVAGNERKAAPRAAAVERSRWRARWQNLDVADNAYVRFDEELFETFKKGNSRDVYAKMEKMPEKYSLEW